jgi:hypothetical protein
MPLALGLLGMTLCVAGCSHGQSESEAVKKSLEVNGLPKADVVPFAGTLTIDNQAPAIDPHNPLFVFAYDPKNPPKGRALPHNTRCDKTGHFAFNTYGTGDGLPAGSYVILFAQPKPGGGDSLKNLYNDPDQNAKEERFQITLTAPGKTDSTFDLATVGKDPVTAPGPHAVMADRGKKKRG